MGAMPNKAPGTKEKIFPIHSRQRKNNDKLHLLFELAMDKLINQRTMCTDIHLLLVHTG